MNKKIAYIDAEYISKEIISSIRNGNYDLYIFNNDAVIADDLQIHYEHVASSRNYNTYRWSLMQLLESFFAKEKAEGTFKFKAYDLFDIIRYDLLFSVEKNIHPYWVLTNSLEEHRADEFHFYSDDEMTYENHLRVNRYFTHEECAVQVHYVGKPFTKKGLLRKIAKDSFEFFNFFAAPILSFLKARINKHKLIKTADIFFLEAYPNSAKISKKISEKLNEKKVLNSLFVATRQKVFGLSSTNAILIDETTGYKGIQVFFAYLSFWQNLKKLIRVNLGSHDRETFVWKAINGGLRKHVIRSIYFILSYEKLIDRFNPSKMITTNFAGSFSRAFCAVSAERGIQTFYVQHGLLGEGPLFQYFKQTRIFVWGDFYRKSLTNFINTERVVVTGSPIYSKNSTENKSPISQEKCIVFFASKPGGAVVNRSSYEAMINIVLESTSDLSTKVIIKLHPTDSGDDVASIIGKQGNVFIEKSLSANELILTSSICIVSSSTTGLEVCSQQKPLIYLDVNPNAKFVDYERFGAALIATNACTLREAIDQYEKPEIRAAIAKGQSELIRDYLDNIPSDSIERIVSGIFEK